MNPSLADHSIGRDYFHAIPARLQVERVQILGSFTNHSCGQLLEGASEEDSYDKHAFETGSAFECNGEMKTLTSGNSDDCGALDLLGRIDCKDLCLRWRRLYPHALPPGSVCLASSSLRSAVAVLLRVFLRGPSAEGDDGRSTTADTLRHFRSLRTSAESPEHTVQHGKRAMPRPTRVSARR